MRPPFPPPTSSPRDIEVKNKSNMYGFVEDTINPLCGPCSHKCGYCYAEKLKQRFEAINTKYSGKVRLDEKVLKKRLKKGVKYFVGSCNDIFADNVPFEMKKAIIDWCNNNSQSEILLQTKNPEGLFVWNEISKTMSSFMLMPHITVCVTIETDDDELIKSVTNAPFISKRNAIAYLMCHTQITIEPIMKIKDIYKFTEFLSNCHVEQINIGADSGNNNLIEPTKEEVLLLISELKRLGQKVHLKENLKRIIG